MTSPDTSLSQPEFWPTSFVGHTQVATEEDGLLRLPELGECQIGRVLQVPFREAAQDGFRLGRPQPQGRGVLDHLVVLPADQLGVPIATEQKTTIFTLTGVQKGGGADASGCGSILPR